jgi:hypothetical protein
LAELSPEQVMLYVPTGLAGVAVVAQFSVPANELMESPFTKPLAVTAFKDGLAAPYARVPLVAASVNGAAVMLSVPATNVIV